MATESGPLGRIRICDFSGQLAGAGATRILAAFGAEVIRIEDPVNQGRWDLLRGGRPPLGEEPVIERGGGFNNHNVQKKGVTINLRDERGLRLLQRLVSVSDVVTENFAPGVLARRGVTYEWMRAIRPDVVYVSNSGFGSDGPYSGYKSWGPVVQAISGLTFTSALADQPPAGWGYSYMDHQGAYFMAMAVLAGLIHRERTGEGQWIDMSMTEVAGLLLGPMVLDATVNETRLRDLGVDSNRSTAPEMAPHGIYPARGEDEWVAIACRADDDWDRLRSCIGERWSDDERLHRLADRVARQDELDQAIAAWTRGHDKHRLARQLVEAGVPAAPVRTPAERIDEDEHTGSWGLWPTVEHSIFGPVRVEGLPVHLSESDWSLDRGAPTLGQHNRDVFGDLLGVGDEELAQLSEDGVI